MWAEKQAQTAESNAKREREGKTTKKRIQHAREQLTPEAQGHPPPASRPLFCRQRALQTERAGRGAGPRGQEGDEKTPAARLTSSVHPQRAVQKERAGRSQSHDPRVSRYVGRQARAKRKDVSSQSSECTSDITEFRPHHLFLRPSRRKNEAPADQVPVARGNHECQEARLIQAMRDL